MGRLTFTTQAKVGNEMREKAVIDPRRRVSSGSDEGVQSTTIENRPNLWASELVSLVTVDVFNRFCGIVTRCKGPDLTHALRPVSLQ